MNAQIPETGPGGENGLVVVEGVVEVGDGFVVELVQAAEVAEHGLEGLLDGRQLKEPVDHHVEHWDKPGQGIRE